MDLTTRFVRTAAERDALAEPWLRRRSHADRTHIAQHPRWLEVLDRAPDTQQTMAVALCRGDDVVGVAPLRWRADALEYRAGVVMLRRQPVVMVDVLGDGFLAPDDEAIHGRLLDEVLALCGRAEILHFPAVTVGGPTFRALQAAGGSGRAWVYEYSRAPHHYLRLPGSFDDYLQKFDGKKRRQLRYEARRLEKEEGFAFECVRGKGALDGFLTAVEHVSERSWQGKLVERIASSAVRDQLEAEGALGWLRSYLLRAGGAPAAFVLGSQEGGVYYYDKIAFDPRFAPLSPGKVLLFKLIEHLYGEDRPAWIDFGYSDSEYKRFFGNVVVDEASFYVVKKWAPAALRLGPWAAYSKGVRAARDKLVALGWLDRAKALQRRMRSWWSRG